MAFASENSHKNIKKAEKGTGNEFESLMTLRAIWDK